MAGKRKGPRRPVKRRGRKPTKGDKPRTLRLVPPKPPTAAEVKAQLEQERLEFERRARHRVAQAAIALDPVDVRILEHLVLRPYLTQEEIGDLVGLGRQAVNERINAAKFKRAIQESAKSAIEIFEQNKARAARKLGLLIDDPDSRIAIRAAVAHMWPHIHADAGASGADEFVKMLQDAAELAETEHAAKVATGTEVTKA